MKKLILYFIVCTSLFASVIDQNERLNRASEILTNSYSKVQIQKIKKPDTLASLVKSEFETNDEFLDRKKQTEIQNIEYEKIVNKLKAQAQVQALSVILPSIYGEARVDNLTYIADSKSFVATLRFEKMGVSDTISIKIPSKEARAFKRDFKSTKVVPSFGMDGNDIYLERVKFITKDDKEYVGEFTNQYFKISQQKLTLSKNYIEIEKENVKKQEKYMMANQLYENDLERMLRETPQAKEDPTKWAIVIGVEDYVFSENISFAKRSAQLFTKVLEKKYGIPNQQVFSLLNEKATATIIKSTLKRVLRRVQKGDTIYFYYNGHGIPVPSEKNEPYMLASDASVEFVQDDKFFALKNIYKLLSDSKASNVVAFVDSCFSGATDGKALLKGVAAARLVPKKIGFNRDKMSIMTAGQGRQYSNGYDKKGHRLFSYYVMKNILENGKSMTDMYNTVYRETKNASFKLYGDLRMQEPTFDGNINVKLH